MGAAAGLAKALVAVLLLLAAVYAACFIAAALPERSRWRLRAHYERGFFRQEKRRREPGFRVVEELGPLRRQPGRPVHNIFSVSLYGSNPKYHRGALALARQVRDEWNSCQLYGRGGWYLRVYLHDACPENLASRLLGLNAQVFRVHDPLVRPGNSSGMFWRFLPLTEDVRFVVLDADDRLQSRTMHRMLRAWTRRQSQHAAACGAYPWVRRVLSNHAPWPRQHITGKWWGGDRIRASHRLNDITHYPVRTPFGADELFLRHVVYPWSTQVDQGLLTFYTDPLGWLTHTLAYPAHEDRGARRAYTMATVCST